jgi:hypothetical protein
MTCASCGHWPPLPGSDALELLGLRWIDLDLKRRLLSVRRLLIEIRDTAQFKDAPKPGHGFRTSSIPLRVPQLLLEPRDWQTEQPRR